MKVVHRYDSTERNKRTSVNRLFLLLSLGLVTALLMAGFFYSPQNVLSSDGRAKSEWPPEISPMGAIARGDVPMPDPAELLEHPSRPAASSATTLGLQGNDRLVHSPTAPDFQSETTIAQNGNFVVVGYNDIRGFSLPAVSVSGYAYSADGGATWTDGGQLPTLGPNDQVFGDPDVKSWTDPNTNDPVFFFSSLYSTPLGQSSLCLHVSFDGGATWIGPREVTTATNGTDFPDKEFIGVDPETGRVFMSWTNFGAGTTMRVTYSDDMGLTWNGPTIFSTSIGQGSIPRADGNSDNVYVAWRRASTIELVTSTDNGVTWTGPVAIAGGLANPMNPYGSDRIAGFPGMDIDNSNGNVYITYASRNLFPDFADIYFTRSTNGGVTWSAPVAVNANPGSDRVQFFPWLSVDQTDGRVDVIWYDQINGAGTSDLTDVFHTHSKDGGLTWACATPLTDAPFHAEYGNSTSQPNMGDYNQCVSDNGKLYVSFAKTDLPSYQTYAPDTYVDISDIGTADAPIAFAGINFTETGCIADGYWEPNELIDLFVAVENLSDCVNPITNIVGTLSSLSPNVTILNGTEPFVDLAGAGSTSANISALTLRIDNAFNCGENLELLLRLTTSAGDALIPFTVQTGVPVETVLLTETFDGVAAPALPFDWTSTLIAGALNPWVTSPTFAATGPNSVFCADIAITSNNRLSSPAIAVPPNCSLLDITFDITHNIEDDTERKAWDGALLKVEVNDGFTTVVRLAGFFSELFEPFYPWQMNRQSSSTQPLQDLACWSSNVTPNFNRVHIQYPGLAGTTVRFFWEMGTDNAVGTPTGMFVDNVVVRSIEKKCDCTPTGIGDVAKLAPFRIISVSPNPFNPTTTVRFSLPQPMPVTAEVWSVEGKRVRTLAHNRTFAAGENALRWNGLNANGEPAASGVYFIRVGSTLGHQVSRAVLLK